MPWGNRIRQPPEPRFWKKVIKSDGCWEWSGSRDTWNYGLIWLNKRIEKAHRMSWLIHNGELPKGVLILHKCDNPPCVRPDHLYAGTPKDNMQDAIKRGRFRPGGHIMKKYRVNLPAKHVKSEDK